VAKVMAMKFDLRREGGGKGEKMGGEDTNEGNFHYICFL